LTNSTSAASVAPDGLRARLRQMRPHHWVKNGFVLIGVLFGHQWSGPVLHAGLLAFVAFCAGASAVYVLNDLLDAEADRHHPQKHLRPIASGIVSRGEAMVWIAVLSVIGLTLAWLANPLVALILAAYIALNVAYSAWLKHVAIIDVFAIAAGFMLRILAGTLGLGLKVSGWLFLCGMMVTLFLGFTKRRAEQLMLNGRDGAGQPNHTQTRSVLGNYQAAQLDQYIGICATGTALSYSLYTMSPEVIALHGTPYLIYTVPFILYGMFRYLYLLYGLGQGNDTVRDLVSDPHLIVTVLAWVGCTVWLLRG
jgi:4-hydroxybenzoate polyprenyltransferase